MRTDNLRTVAHDYARQRQALIDATGLDENDECLADTLEGISNLDELIVAALREAKQAQAMAEAIKAIIAENNERRERLIAKAERIRFAVACAMQDAGLHKITAPDMTVSERMSKPAPKVIDADALPAWAKVEKISYAPNRDAIKQAFEEDPQGFSCPGVIVTNAEPVLTVRSK